MKKFVFFLIAVLSAPLVASEDPGDRIIGVWATERAEAHVEISRGESGYEGTITWLKEPFFPAHDEGGLGGQPKVDRENPDPERRSDPIIGMQIMEGFQYAGGGRWTDGRIYDPENGKTYRCKMWLTEEGTLKVRGYVGFSMFGRTSEWTPVITASE